MNTVSKVPKVLWKRLPWIVAYMVAAYALIVVGQMAFYRFMPSSYFLNYYSASANSVQEHSPVPFVVCRTKRFGNHIIEGQRVFYKVLDGANKANAQQVATVPIRGVATADGCADLSVPVNQYDHTEGYYYFRTVFEFKVGGQTKHAEFETNVYAITPKRLGSVEDIQAKIDELQKQIDLLRVQLDQARQQAIVDEQNFQAFVRSSPTPEQEMAVGDAEESRTQATQTPPPEEPSPPSTIESIMSTVNNVVERILP